MSKPKVAIFFLLMCVVGQVAFGYTRQEWITKFDQLHSQINGGDGWSHNSDSGELAWAQAPLLQAYLSMYEATGDIKYLQWFEAHATRMLTTIADNDGDGYLGWWTPDFGPNIVREEPAGQTSPGAYMLKVGAEIGDPTDATLPNGWTRLSTPGFARRRIGTDHAYAGNYCMALTTGTYPGWVLLRKNLELNIGHGAAATYEPNKKYRVYFQGKTAGAVIGRADIFNMTTQQVIASRTFSGSSYATYALDFIAPATAGQDVYLEFYQTNWADYSSVFVDEVSVGMFTEWVVHDGMIASAFCRFVEMVDANNLTAYQALADTLEDVSRYELIHKWDSYLGTPASNRLVYKFSADQGAPGPDNTVPINMFIVMSCAYTSLSNKLGSTGPGLGYGARSLNLINAFGDKWVLYGGDQYYTWRYWPQYLSTDWVVDPYVEDTSHGNLEVAAFVEAYDAGIAGTSTQMDRFVNTFKDKIWNGSLTDPQFNRFVDGTGGFTTGSEKTHLAGWLQLEAYDSSGDIFDAILTLYDNEVYSKTGSEIFGSQMHTIAELIKRW